MKPRINKLYKRMKRHKQSKKRIDIKLFIQKFRK